MIKLYIVLPCYNEEAILEQTTALLTAKLESLQKSEKITDTSRIVYVDDGSKDSTWSLIQKIYAENPWVMGIKLNRNRGHQNALLCGLMTIREDADAVISMDADLQDDIDAIDAMLEKYENGADVVYGVRSARKSDSFFKRFTAEEYYRILNRLGAKVIFNHADFRLMSCRALEALSEFKEVNVFLRGLVPMVGYQSDIVLYERKARTAGESKYPLRKMLHLAWEGITSLSIRPIRLVALAGCLSLVVALGLIIYSIIRLILGQTVAGWTSLMVSIWLVGGLQLLAIGIIGEYIGKIYLETKQRPRYKVEDILKK
ncbi:MAG: glycosyltransferase family 2 protein [Clostridia bacterium]|nr:glycosyltransferase family 2 protein [Clostridia bacterium]